MAICLVTMATATLILFLDEVCELTEARISFYIFFWFSKLSTVFVHYVYFQRN